MYPSKIMTNSLTVADNINVSMHNLNSKFLQMESKYNINNAYNFGFLPYYFAQKIINIWNSDDQTSLMILSILLLLNIQIQQIICILRMIFTK